MGVGIEISIKDHGIEPLLKRIAGNTQNPGPTLNIIGETVRASIVRNFEKSGRPVPWAPHSAVTEKRRGPNAKILWDTKRLEGSINWQVAGDLVTIGTNTVYAAVHHFGAAKGSFGVIEAWVKEHLRLLKSGKKSKVKAHTRKQSLPWGNIPARPFMMVQDQDWDEIRDQLIELLFEA